MKFFLRILAYAKPYSFFAILAVFFNILSVIFSLASVTLVIPVLGVLFGTQERVYEPATFTGSLETQNQNAHGGLIPQETASEDLSGPRTGCRLPENL